MAEQRISDERLRELIKGLGEDMVRVRPVPLDIKVAEIHSALCELRAAREVLQARQEDKETNDGE